MMQDQKKKATKGEQEHRNVFPLTTGETLKTESQET